MSPFVLAFVANGQANAFARNREDVVGASSALIEPITFLMWIFFVASGFQAQCTFSSRQHDLFHWLLWSSHFSFELWCGRHHQRILWSYWVYLCHRYWHGVWTVRIARWDHEFMRGLTHAISRNLLQVKYRIPKDMKRMKKLIKFTFFLVDFLPSVRLSKNVSWYRINSHDQGREFIILLPGCGQCPKDSSWVAKESTQGSSPETRRGTFDFSSATRFEFFIYLLYFYFCRRWLRRKKKRRKKKLLRWLPKNWRSTTNEWRRNVWRRWWANTARKWYPWPNQTHKRILPFPSILK